MSNKDKGKDKDKDKDENEEQENEEDLIFVSPFKKAKKDTEKQKPLFKMPETFQRTFQKPFVERAEKAEKAEKKSQKKKTASKRAAYLESLKKPEPLKKLKSQEVPRSFKESESEFFLVKLEVLSDVIKKTIKVKDALKRGEALTVQDAIEEYEITRDAYYKYRDSVLPFYEATDNKILNLAFSIEHQEGVLANIVTTISKNMGDIITINQGFPINGIASLNVSVDTSVMNIDATILIAKLKHIKGVRSMEILGRINGS